jgi:hypothetical protein
MIRRGTIVLLSLLILTASMALDAEELPTSFLSSHYYILSLGALSFDLSSVIQSASAVGTSVVEFDAGAISVDRGTEDPNVPLETVLGDPSVLVVDSGRLLLSRTGDAYRFTVRPSACGYELVINPSADSDLHETLADVLGTLQELGLLGAEVSLQFSSFAKAELKGPQPPADLAIESTLYGLTVAADWFSFAAAQALTQVGLRVAVVAEKLPGAQLNSQFAPYVEQETDSLVRLLLPIDQLLPLARSASVGYVRTPRQPFVP